MSPDMSQPRKPARIYRRIAGRWTILFSHNEHGSKATKPKTTNDKRRRARKIAAASRRRNRT